MLSASTLQMKFMQRAAIKRGEPVTPSSPAASLSPGPSTPARLAPGSPSTPSSAGSPQTPRESPPGSDSETQWILYPSNGSTTPASGSPSQASTSQGTASGSARPPVRISYAQSYMSFMQDEESSEEEEDEEGMSGQKAEGSKVASATGSLGKGRMGFGDFAPKVKEIQAPVLITEGLSNGMKPRPSSSTPRGNPSPRYPANLPLNQPPSNLPPHLRADGRASGSPQARVKGSAKGNASPLSRVVLHTMSANRAAEGMLSGRERSGSGSGEGGTGRKVYQPKLDSRGFAKPAEFDDLPTSRSGASASGSGSGSGAGPSQRKKQKKRAAPTEEFDEGQNGDHARAGDGSVISADGTEDKGSIAATGADDADTDILPNGARAAKKAKKNKNKKQKQKESRKHAGAMGAEGDGDKAEGEGLFMDAGDGGDDGDEVDRLMKEVEQELGSD